MAILNLIGSSGESSRGSCKLKVPGGLRLSSTFRSKELNDVIRHSVLITGAPFGIGAVYADRFARRGSDTVALGRTRRRAPFQRIFRLTGQAQALLEGGTSHTCLRADPGRSVHQVSFEASLIP